MRPDDDTINKGAAARTDAWFAMLEANLIPGHIQVALENANDLERLNKEVEKGAALLIYRIPREVSERGAEAGRVCALVLAGLPAKAQGNVILTFDGWNTDPREMFEIPQAVDFCRGLLLGDIATPSLEQAHDILTILLDEEKLAFVDGELVKPDTLTMSGRMWLIGAAFPGEVYFRDRRAPSGWMRDWDKSLQIRNWLLGQSGPPKS